MRPGIPNSPLVPSVVTLSPRRRRVGGRAAAAVFMCAIFSVPLLAQPSSDYTDFSTAGLPGRLYIPPTNGSADGPRPFIVALHGGGGIGTDNSRHLVDFTDLLTQAKARRAFLYVPQATSAYWDAGNRPELIMAMIDQAAAAHEIDRDRLYLTGFSMGGGGVWNLLARYPDRFAAAVPIAAIAPGAGFSADAVIGRPTRVFHARDDPVVSVETGRSTVSAVLQAAGRSSPAYPAFSDRTSTFDVAHPDLTFHYTEWPSGGHSIWWRVYRDADLLAWLFNQRLAPAPPKMLEHPKSATVPPGEKVSFVAEATSSEAMTFQWLKDNQVVPGATSSSLHLDSVTREAEGWYQVAATNRGGTTASRPARLVVAPPVAGRLVNLSVRGLAGRAERPLIVGVVSSRGPQRVVLRAIGPALARFDIADPLADPQLDVFRIAGDAATLMASNDDWGGGGALRDAFTAVGAFALDEGTSRDAALLAEIQGPTTAHVHGGGDGAGTVLVEAYDLDLRDAARLVNVSARNEVTAGEGALIAGFVVSGNAPRRFLVRAVGPGLREFAVPDVLPDPGLAIHTRINGVDTIVAANDDWEDEANQAAAQAVPGAFGLQPGSKDAMILLTLPAGIFSAVVSGAGSTSGEALVEIYDVDELIR